MYMCAQAGTPMYTNLWKYKRINLCSISYYDFKNEEEGYWRVNKMMYIEIPVLAYI